MYSVIKIPYLQAFFISEPTTSQWGPTGRPDLRAGPSFPGRDGLRAVPFFSLGTGLFADVRARARRGTIQWDAYRDGIAERNAREAHASASRLFRPRCSVFF